MSGRLVINRQKSYCPWKPENVARAARTEKASIETEKTREKTALQRALEMRSRLDEITPTPQHINLFEKEENEHCLLKEISTSQTVKKEKQRRRCTAVYLDQSSRHDPKRSRFQKDDQAKIEKEKLELDPMKDFHQATDSRKEKVQKDKKKNDRKRHRKSATTVKKSSLEELRKLRLARERQERDREQAIIDSHTR